MSEYHRPPGKTTVSPEVLITIARMAALSVPGVSAMAPVRRCGPHLPPGHERRHAHHRP